MALGARRARRLSDSAADARQTGVVGRRLEGTAVGAGVAVDARHVGGVVERRGDGRRGDYADRRRRRSVAAAAVPVRHAAV